MISHADTRCVPRLTGAPNVDFPEILTKYRLVVGFRAKPARVHDDDFAEALAHEYFSLNCDAPCLTPYQQIVSEQIDWQSETVPSDARDDAASFATHTTGTDLKSAILHLLMLVDSVHDYPLTPSPP